MHYILCDLSCVTVGSIVVDIIVKIIVVEIAVETIVETIAVDLRFVELLLEVTAMECIVVEGVAVQIIIVELRHGFFSGIARTLVGYV